MPEQLGRHWPIFVAYLVSFFTIGIIWVNHHALIAELAKVDRSLLFINLGLLLFVVAIPFGTALMASYLTDGGLDGKLAMAIYCAILEGMSLGFGALFAWSLGEGRRHHPIPPEVRRSTWWRFTIGGLIYVLAIGAAFIAPAAALLIVGATAVYYIFERGAGGEAYPTRQ